MRTPVMQACRLICPRISASNGREKRAGAAGPRSSADPSLTGAARRAGSDATRRAAGNDRGRLADG